MLQAFFFRLQKDFKYFYKHCRKKSQQSKCICKNTVWQTRSVKIIISKILLFLSKYGPSFYKKSSKQLWKPKPSHTSWLLFRKPVTKFNNSDSACCNGPLLSFQSTSPNIKGIIHLIWDIFEYIFMSTAEPSA